MAKPVKVLILIITLGLPVCIYLFLQGFGENIYALPVFPEEAVPEGLCKEVGPGYTVKKLVCGGKDAVVMGDDQNYIFHFPDTSETGSEMNEIRRLVEETKDVSYRLITFAGEVQLEQWDKVAVSQANDRYWVATSACAGDVEELKACQLLLGLAEVKPGYSSSRMVLVDGKGQIRGFYTPDERKEIDRLLVELDILMQEK
jgi:protein SCO1/2